MNTHRCPQRGDVYSIDFDGKNTASNAKLQGFIVVTPGEINALGVSITVPIVSAENVDVSSIGLVVPVTGTRISGVAVCNQLRSFDIETRVNMQKAAFIESIEGDQVAEVVARVLSVLDPAE